MRKEPRTQLGELESEIMGIVWGLGEATVADVRVRLGEERAAYTTVMTVMSRLAGKKLLRRRKEGRAYVYEATQEQSAMGGSLLHGLVERLYGGSSSRAIAHLIDHDPQVDDAELARLERLIRRKRRERPS